MWVPEKGGRSWKGPMKTGTVVMIGGWMNQVDPMYKRKNAMIFRLESPTQMGIWVHRKDLYLIGHK